MMKRFLTWLYNNIVLVLTGIVILPINMFIAYKNGKIDMLFADAISDNNLLQTPFLAHDINIQSIHTHLLKWPIVLIENAVGFDARTHIITSFFLLVAMNALLGYLFYVFSRKNQFITAVCLLLLMSVELMTGLSANEGTLTMITIRNIEIPLTIALVLFLIRSKRAISIRIIIASLLLGIIFVSDQLLMFASIIGACLYYCYGAIKAKHLSSNLLTDSAYYIGIIIAALIAKLISIGFGVLGIANFYSLQNTNDTLVYVSSFEDFFNLTIKYIGKIFDVFGAGFFGQPLVYGPLYVANLALLFATIYLGIKLFKHSTEKTPADDHERTITALFLMFFCAILVFTLLIPRELAGRYFAFVPILGLLLIARQFNTVKLRVSKKNIAPIILCFCVAFTLLAVMALCANDIYYRSKYHLYSSRLGDTSYIISILEKEKTNAFFTMDIYEHGYWDNQVIKQQYDEKTGQHLSIGSLFCNNFVVDRQFSRRSWATPHGERVAIRVKGCDLEKIKRHFGTPSMQYSLGKEDHILIYSTDIRDQFNMAQYDTNRFVK